MGITYGDHLIDSGYHDITPEQEREIEAREECARRGLDPDDDAADDVAVWMVVDKEMRERAAVPAGVYESAVRGRSDFREAYRKAQQEAKELREFVAWVDTWVSNPVGSYSHPALAGLFSQTREKIALLAALSRS